MRIPPHLSVCSSPHRAAFLPLSQIATFLCLIAAHLCIALPSNAPSYELALSNNSSLAINETLSISYASTCYTPYQRYVPVTYRICSPVLLDLSANKSAEQFQTFYGSSPVIYRNRYSACTITIATTSSRALIRLTPKQISIVAAAILDRCTKWNRGGSAAIGNSIFKLEIDAKRPLQAELLSKNVAEHLGR